MNNSAINLERMETLKIDLLDYVENMNSIFNQLDIEFDIIKQNLTGTGSLTVRNKINSLQAAYTIIKKNITTYATDIQKVIDSFQDQDENISSKITSDIAKIEKLEGE